MARRTLVGAIASIALTAALAFGVVSTAAGGDGTQRATVAGSWMVNVDRGPALPALKSLQSYTGGHAVIEISNGGATVRSPSHGAWQRTGDRTFASTIVFFRYDPVTGAYVGTAKIRHTLELARDGQSFTGVAVAEFRDAAGNLLPIPPHRDSVSGERINVEPIP
jgi:hypothetical protein